MGSGAGQTKIKEFKNAESSEVPLLSPKRSAFEVSLLAIFFIRSGSALAGIAVAPHSDQLFMSVASYFLMRSMKRSPGAFRQVADYHWPRNLLSFTLCEKEDVMLGSGSTTHDPSISPICREGYSRLQVRWRVLATLETLDYR